MRMNNRFCRMGKAVLGACLLLSMSGLAYSCSDDYDLDDKKPNFLGGSIYDELKSLGNFKTTILLIDDLNYTDVMSKTGSKTLFVANDEAYDAFFKNNPWGVKSYEGLTMAQKRILFNGAQLNNAYVVEMMSNCENGEKNLCLRQACSAAQLPLPTLCLSGAGISCRSITMKIKRRQSTGNAMPIPIRGAFIWPMMPLCRCLRTSWKGK